MSTVAYAPNFDLFTLAELAAAERLAASPLGGLLPGEAVVDLFAGAGGWDQGAGEAGLPCHAAINHDEVAIGCHEQNHPACLHFRGDAWRVKPSDVMRQIRERFGLTALGVLLASAACTTHSPARGAAPISKRVHMLGWCIARWMKANYFSGFDTTGEGNFVDFGALSDRQPDGWSGAQDDVNNTRRKSNFIEQLSKFDN